MQNQGYLGIHLSRHWAAVVCVQSPQDTQNSAVFFEISLTPEQIEAGAGFNELITLIAQTCTQRQLQFALVAIALDCSLYMQHDVRSSFTDPKQLANTVRFDAEEALATDISDVALAFTVKSTDENGSYLSVFTVEKNILAELIKALASNNLDPAVIEPDVNCICVYLNVNHDFETETIVAALSSKSNVYLIGSIGPEKKNPIVQRTLLVGDSSDKNRLLNQQIPLTLARFDSDIPQKLNICDSTNSVQTDFLAQNLSMDVQPFKLNSPKDCPDAVSFAAAAGAVITAADSRSPLNFRNDFMPYLGKKRRLENTLKIISISASIILLALGLSLQLKMIKRNQPLKELHNKFEDDYKTVMLKKSMPSKSLEALKKLKTESRRVENLKKGLGGNNAAARLTALLRVFNEVAKKTNLNIEKISITQKTITLKGDTANQSGTLKFLNEIKNNNTLNNVESERLGAAAGRHTFNITIGAKN